MGTGVCPQPGSQMLLQHISLTCSNHGKASVQANLRPRTSNLHLHLLFFLGGTLSTPSFTRGQGWTINCLHSLGPTSLSDSATHDHPHRHSLGSSVHRSLRELSQQETRVGNGEQDQGGVMGYGEECGC